MQTKNDIAGVVVRSRRLARVADWRLRPRSLGVWHQPSPIRSAFVECDHMSAREELAHGLILEESRYPPALSEKAAAWALRPRHGAADDAVDGGAAAAVFVAQAGEDVAGLGHLAGEPVELRRGQHHLPFGDDSRRRGDRGECIVRVDPVLAGGAGESPVDEDPLCRSPEGQR